MPERRESAGLVVVQVNLYFITHEIANKASLHLASSFPPFDIPAHFMLASAEMMLQCLFMLMTANTQFCHFPAWFGFKI